MSRGRTVVTMAIPETTDDEDAGTLRPTGSASGSKHPFLHRFAVPVDGEVTGRTRMTKAAPETTDEETATNPVRAGNLVVAGRTITTRVGAETSDDEPRG